MKIGNREAGRLGFYARLTGPAGTPLQGVTYAVNPPGAALAISTKAMTDANTGTLPTAWREWSYVGARLVPTLGWPPFEPSWLCKPEIAVHASDFALLAEGGTPPYRWGLSEGVQPDWQEYLRLQIALIGDGFIANIDHSPTIRTGVQEEGGKLASLDESVVLAAHRKMAAWANPEGLPPLYESYTWVNPGPLVAADWGYNTINLARNTIYLHMIETPYGKTGMPKDGKLSVGPLAQTVVSAVCMNTGQRIEFQQNAEKLVLELSKLTADPVDTIVKLSLAGPHPEGTPPSPKDQASPPGNLAWHKPARLLSLDCTHSLIASGFNFAHYGTDGFLFTHAQGGMEWPWTYQVDLEEIHPVNRLVVHFGSGYPTEYEVQISADGESWQSIHRGAGTAEGKYTFEIKSIPTRYVRVKGIKPDGPDREGSQMSIAELEVYAAE
ncbi:MAG: discoidin domain-containing protein [Candidatus Hydrogenedentes bacterium]|nr:discoidin domain-containing protein [Candidatus Hydrogenedentota bacterium]